MVSDAVPFLGHGLDPHVGVEGDLLGRLGRVADHVGTEHKLHRIHHLTGSLHKARPRGEAQPVPVP